MDSFHTTWFQTIHQQGKFEFNVAYSRPGLKFWMPFFSDLLLACCFCPDMHALAVNLQVVWLSLSEFGQNMKGLVMTAF